MNDSYIFDEQQTLSTQLTKSLSILHGLIGQTSEDQDTNNLKEKAISKITNAKKLIEEIKPSASDPLDRKQERLQIAQAATKEAVDYVELFEQYILKTKNVSQNEALEIKNKIDEILKKRTEDKSHEWVHILHLSDLHFGYYYHSSLGTKQQDKEEYFAIVQTALFDFLRKYIKTNGKIDIIAITGDLSYQNDENGYADFGNWLKELCAKEILNIDIKKKVIMCVGNHDSGYVNRTEHGILSNEEAKSEDKSEQCVDSVLTIDNIAKRQEQFKYFNNLCLHLEIERLTNFDTPPYEPPLHYLFGQREIDGINFIVLNTAWNSFPQKTKDGKENGYNHGNLYLGQRLIRSILPKQKNSEITVTLFHHPLSWLHETESRSYGNDQELPVLKRVREHSDIILNGHVHGKIEPPDILSNNTLVFSGGTLSTNDSPSFQFEILSINTVMHYCTQKIVTYNRQSYNGQTIGWEIESKDNLTPFYFDAYRSARELIAKITLNEITKEEAINLANADVRQAFEELYKKTKFHEIHHLIEPEPESSP